MTANELVVYLEDITDSEESPYRQAATMLRQQQAEIERLTMLCDCMTTESNRKGNEIEELKAHSVKEITDFEIKGVMALDECWVGEDCSMPNMIAFARAILRKASEK